MNTFKKTLHIIKTLPGRLRRSSVHVKALAILLLCGAVAGAFYYSTRQSDQTFALDYAAYAALAAQGDNAAYIPGAETNPVRVAIEQDLTEMLGGTVSDPERLTLATEGLALISQSESQIGDISSTSAEVDDAIAKMQVDTVGGVDPSEKATQIIALAKERESTISDIRAYSYKSDFETEQIFSTIIKAKGALTDAYIIELNDEIPAVQDEFDKRTDLYNQLQATAVQIESVYSGTAAPSDGSGGS